MRKHLKIKNAHYRSRKTQRISLRVKLKKIQNYYPKQELQITKWKLSRLTDPILKSINYLIVKNINISIQIKLNASNKMMNYKKFIGIWALQITYKVKINQVNNLKNTHRNLLNTYYQRLKVINSSGKLFLILLYKHSFRMSSDFEKINSKNYF